MDRQEDSDTYLWKKSIASSGRIREMTKGSLGTWFTESFLSHVYMSTDYATGSQSSSCQLFRFRGYQI